MKKTIKILFILLLFVTVSKVCLAVNIEMNLVNSTTSSEQTNNNVSSANNTANYTNILNSTITNTFDTNNVSANSTTNSAATNSDTSSSTSQTETDTSVNVSSLSSLPESELGLTNILNIILIAIGFILILLSIAILIRLSNK